MVCPRAPHSYGAVWIHPHFKMDLSFMRTASFSRGRPWVLALAAVVGFGGAGRVLSAQGTTTAAVSGQVTQGTGQPVADAQIQVRNTATGFNAGTVTRADGRYYIQGLEVGGPYTITARRIGLEQQLREGIILRLGQNFRLDFNLREAATTLSEVRVTADEAADFNPARQGVATTVDDTLLRRIPTLTRDFTDFVKLTPQVSQPTSDAPSANGAYNRLNNYTIDGANQNDRFNLGSSEGVPGGASGARSISIEAVKEFQVLLSPTDVRYGNFGGMLVNAVTKNGTNDLHGGATFAYRSPDLAADEEFIKKGDLQVKQYGFQLGGPLIRDKLHFYVAPEWQQRSSPAVGQYIGPPDCQTSGCSPGTPGLITTETLDSIRTALTSDFDPGTGDLLKNKNPLVNLFGRLDYQMSDNTRVVLRQLWNTADNDSFSRNANSFNTGVSNQNSGFRLTSNKFRGENKNYSTVVQAYTNVGAGSNELIAGYNFISDERIVPIAAPEISVGVTYDVPGATPGAGVATFGTEQFSPGNKLEQKIFELSDNYSFPIGAHQLTAGGRFENTHIFNNFAQRSYGVYAFSNITNLINRTPLNYSFGYDNGGGIPAEFSVRQYSLYAQDMWTFTPDFTLTYGVRADIPQFVDKPAFNQNISTITTALPLGEINTATKPKTQVLWSPRVGFNWNPGGNSQNQVRGNVGVFTSPPPLILLANAYANTGLGLVTLNCTATTGGVPPFETDITQLPKACGPAGTPPPAAGAAGTAGININNPNFKYPQNFTTSLGFDRMLPYGVVFTFEGLYRKAINGLLVIDRNLTGPRQVGGAIYRDENGRALYADTMTFAANGSQTVNLTNQRYIRTIGTPAVTFSEGIIEVKNQNKDYNWSLSGQARKRFTPAFELTAAYTYMQSKDVMSLTSDRAISNWRNGRTFAGPQDQLDLTTSYFERPHRVLTYGTYTLPWKSTDISLYYEGMSGTPVTYTANGDLNGDGTNSNDAIYIPRDATDVTEILIGTGTGPTFVTDPARAQAFEDFISKQDCLKSQRGKIMERNSCKSPWQNRMDFSVRQSLPYRGQALTLQLDIVNFLNLLNKDWGQIELPGFSANFPQQAVLRPVGRTPGPLGGTGAGKLQFQFDPNNVLVDPKEPTNLTNRIYYARQDDTRNFYQMQLTLRYAF